jgi:hypothetical protein
MQLLDMRGGYLYEHRPDIIPQGFLTNEEIAIWSVYLERKHSKVHHGGSR